MANKKRSNNSALVTVLKAFIPYSRENIALAFSPNRFFNELERSSGHSKTTLKHAYWKARRDGLVETEGQRVAKLTSKGLREVRPFIAEKLGSRASLMVIFDIPEPAAKKRQQLRYLLRSLGFSQVQKSVWSCSYDHREILAEAISEMGLDGCVEVYESLKILPRS